MSYPENLRYTDDHEWARLEDDGTVTVGITAHAQEALGDVVYVELPEAGAELEKGGQFGVVESVKAVSDLFSPCAGTVAAVNESLEDAPEAINSDPYGAGWIARLSISDVAEFEALMDATAYAAHVEAEAG